jgi:hypothetical protein
MALTAKRRADAVALAVLATRQREKRIQAGRYGRIPKNRFREVFEPPGPHEKPKITD